MVTVPRLVGNHADVRVTILGATFLRATGTNRLRFPDDQFGSDLIDRVLHREGILSKKKGIRAKSHHCRNCGSDLTGANLRRCKFLLDMRHRQLPAFKVEIEMSAKKCPECGTASALDEKEVELNICQAIIKAFQTKKISR